MSEDEKKTLWDLDLDTFVVPGQSQNGVKPLPDLVFKRDEHVRGLYRATIDPDSFFTRDHRDSNEIQIKRNNGK